MTQPYPTEHNPLRTLTDNGIGHFRKLNERDEQELELLRSERARLASEIDSIDDVMTDLYETIGRREAKMRGDVVRLLLPAPQPDSQHVDMFAGSQSFEPGLPPEREAAAQRFNAAHDELSQVES